MIIEAIVFIIFVLSLGGVLFILVRKIPVLSSLPQNGSVGIRKHKIISAAENRIKNISVTFQKQIFMHRFLSWVKIMTIKVETHIDVLLRVIRKKAQQIDKDNKDKK